MTSLWDFKVGDRVFCIWPKDELKGGFHIVKEVTPGHIRVEGFKYYVDKGRFVLMNPYVSPIKQKEEVRPSLSPWSNLNPYAIAQASAIGRPFGEWSSGVWRTL